MTTELPEYRSQRYTQHTEGFERFCLDGWSILKFSGKDRENFLHNMCTNEILKLGEGDGCEAFLTDVKGKIVAHVIVLNLENEILLLSVPGQSEKIMDHMERYIIREDVQIIDATDNLTALLFTGSRVHELESTLKFDADSIETPWKSTSCYIGEDKSLVAKGDFLWTNNYLVVTANSDNEYIDSDSDWDVWNVLRVESSFPLYGVDFDSSNLPQEVDRNQQAINFNKGCYLGQETIARIDALGHVNKKICRLKFFEAQVPSVGTLITADSLEVGVVTSACWSPKEQAPIALAMIRRGYDQEGKELNSMLGKVQIVPRVATA